MSHPAWVCGLKLRLLARLPPWRSHTLRGCVDWNSQCPFPQNFYRSHTLRGCVDWNLRFLMRLELCLVTPCVGVWIETIGTYLILRHDPVTPCVGVWIETRAHHHCTPKTAVTPCVGVWIETSISNNENVADMSHPAWVCGLKQCNEDPFYCSVLSHPAWVCGLKHLSLAYL